MTSKDIFAFEAIGELSKKDYTDVLFPVFNQARKEGKKIRFLFYFGEKFTGYSKEAMWEDFKLGLKFLRVIDRCAIVTDLGWIASMSSIFGGLIPCPVEVFKNHDLDSAKAWIDSGELALNFSLDENKGILKVEISAPLSSLDFEVMTHTVDSYLERKGILNGVLLHVKNFPGWKDLGSFIYHFEFIKAHHKKVKKVALVTDSKLAEIFPSIAKHFISADIQNFSDKEFDKAEEWVRLN